jgi:hypothetical protein
MVSAKIWIAIFLSAISSAQAERHEPTVDRNPYGFSHGTVSRGPRRCPDECTPAGFANLEWTINAEDFATVTANDATVRIDFEDSSDCGGSTEGRGFGEATATVDLDGAVDLDVSFSGAGESGYENLLIVINGQTVADLTISASCSDPLPICNGSGYTLHECSNQIVTVPLAAGSNTIVVTGNTKDGVAHQDAYFAISFVPQGIFNDAETGPDCSTCNNEPPCASDPCENGGTCLELVDDGINSTINRNGSPCGCEDGTNFCNYDAGNTGTCEACLSSAAECENDGLPEAGVQDCKDRCLESYVCDCAAGFNGTNCETDIRDCFSIPSPCQNEGICTDGIDSYTCNCAAGFSGDNCETDIDDCLSTPCQNGGICNDGIDSYTCSCAEGYSSRCARPTLTNVI